MKTLLECRDEVARNWGYKDWRDSRWDGSAREMDAGELYAKYKTQELQSRVSELQKEVDSKQNAFNVVHDQAVSLLKEKERLEREVKDMKVDIESYQLTIDLEIEQRQRLERENEELRGKFKGGLQLVSDWLSGVKPTTSDEVQAQLKELLGF